MSNQVKPLFEPMAGFPSRWRRVARWKKRLDNFVVDVYESTCGESGALAIIPEFGFARVFDSDAQAATFGCKTAQAGREEWLAGRSS